MDMKKDTLYGILTEEGNLIGRLSIAGELPEPPDSDYRAATEEEIINAFK